MSAETCQKKALAGFNKYLDEKGYYISQKQKTVSLKNDLTTAVAQSKDEGFVLQSSCIDYLRELLKTNISSHVTESLGEVAYDMVRSALETKLNKLDVKELQKIARSIGGKDGLVLGVGATASVLVGAITAVILSELFVVTIAAGAAVTTTIVVGEAAAVAAIIGAATFLESAAATGAVTGGATATAVLSTTAVVAIGAAVAAVAVIGVVVYVVSWTYAGTKAKFIDDAYKTIKEGDSLDTIRTAFCKVVAEKLKEADLIITKARQQN